MRGWGCVPENRRRPPRLPLAPVEVLVPQNRPGVLESEGPGGRQCLAQLLPGAGTFLSLREGDTEDPATRASGAAGDGAAWRPLRGVTRQCDRRDRNRGRAGPGGVALFLPEQWPERRWGRGARRLDRGRGWEGGGSLFWPGSRRFPCGTTSFPGLAAGGRVAPDFGWGRGCELSGPPRPAPLPLARDGARRGRGDGGRAGASRTIQGNAA